MKGDTEAMSESPCDKTNCVCEKVPGWPQTPVAGYVIHLHNTEPRAGSGVGGVNE